MAERTFVKIFIKVCLKYLFGLRYSCESGNYCWANRVARKGCMIDATWNERESRKRKCAQRLSQQIGQIKISALLKIVTWIFNNGVESAVVVRAGQWGRARVRGRVVRAVCEWINTEARTARLRCPSDGRPAPRCRTVAILRSLTATTLSERTTDLTTPSTISMTLYPIQEIFNVIYKN